MRKDYNFTDILAELEVKSPNFQLLMTNVLLVVIVIFLGVIWKNQKNYEEELDQYRSDLSRLEQNYQKLIALETLQDTVGFPQPSSDSQESMMSSSNKASSSSSSKTPKSWSPTANSEVNRYLNQPGGTVKLRGIVVLQVDNDISQGENWVEIQSSFIGINLEESYQEYAIVNDRLYVRMMEHTLINLGTEISIDAHVIEKVNNERLGILALEAKEFRILSSKETPRQSSSVETVPSSINQQSPPWTIPSISSSIPQSSPPITVPESSSAPVPTVYYENCSAASRAGVSNIRVGDPGYAPHLDRDKDGIGCEE